MSDAEPVSDCEDDAEPVGVKDADGVFVCDGVTAAVGLREGRGGEEGEVRRVRRAPRKQNKRTCG